MNQENNGALFSNQKTKETQPDYRGKANVNGKDMEISAWIKLSKDGKKYLSLSFQEPLKASRFIWENIDNYKRCQYSDI